MFALTLYFYSPRAYRYIRQKFSNNLPSKSTITSWYANTSASGVSGFCQQSIEVLSERAKKLKADGIEPTVALIFDEMAIKKTIKWSHNEKKFIGHITYGFRPDGSHLPIANNALVFMLNGINFNLTLPIAHHFINTLKAEEKATLLKDVITEITKHGVRVLSVTFDGFSTNFTSCELLGANFDPNNMTPYFVLPGYQRKIYIIIDPSHVLKLVRNTLGNNKILSDGSSDKIEWLYFEVLQQLRADEGFSHVHKLNKQHIDFKNCKMNVRIAAETLSNSVANSMEYLMKSGRKEFSKCSATIKFVRLINDCFDIMNTKRIGSETKFKNAINPKNSIEIFALFEKLSDYLQKIKFSTGELAGKYVIKTRNKTAFKGLVVNMINFKFIYEELVETNLLDYLPTFAFSQDHIESFFGRIRSSPSFNDNPTVFEFCSAFKKIVVCNEIVSSEKSNCADNLNLAILDVSSARRNQIPTINSDTEDSDDARVKRLIKFEKKGKSNDLLKISNAYIACTIEDTIKTSARFECGDCYDLLSINDKLSDSFAPGIGSAPCQSTFDICDIAHKYVENLAQDAEYTYDNVIRDFLCEFDVTNAFKKTNFAGHETHRDFFVDFILKSYIRIQATYIARRVTLNEKKLMGNKFRKFVHFAGA